MPAAVIGWSGRALIGALSLCLLVRSAAAEVPYLSAEAGFAYWPDTSNSDELEADSAAGWLAGLAAGLRFPWLRVELEAVHRASRIHGLNSGGVNLSGDGNTLHATGLMVNVWPGVEVAERVEIYGGGGIGATRLAALGDEGCGFTWQAGSGVVARVGERFAFDLGYRYYRVEDMRLGGFRAAYDSKGLILRLTYRFDD